MSLPRATSRTSLCKEPLLSHSTPSSTPEMSPAVPFSLSAIMSSLHPRKARQRTTFLALFTLMFISTYVFFISSPALSLSSLSLRTDHNGSAAKQIAVAIELGRNSRLAVIAAAKAKLARPQSHSQVQLNSDQELAAISSFLASLPQNVIPSSVDPSHPIDPQLVLDFDTRSSRAVEEVNAMVEEVWTRNPVLLYAKHYSPVSREVKTILADMHLHPEPVIFDVDKRDDGDVLKPLLSRLTSSPDLPILLVGGKSVGSITDIRALHESGELKSIISAAGAVIDGAKKRRGRK